jgi:hypothetical protein
MRTLEIGSSALVLALMLALVLVSSSAQEKPGTTPVPAPEYRPVLRPQTEPYASQVIPNPPRKPVRRRSAAQEIDPTERIVTGGIAVGGRPTLEVLPPTTLPKPVAPAPGPILMNSCDAGGCYDTHGARFNNGVGNTLIGPQGQLCTKGVVNTQCF